MGLDYFLSDFLWAEIEDGCFLFVLRTDFD